MEQKSVKVTTTRAELKRKVLFFAISSRAFVLLLSCVANAALSDHDAGVFISPEPETDKSWLDEKVKVVFGGLVRWDAQYFLHIAHHGYTYENTLAFFPFFPVTVRVLAQFLDLLGGSLVNLSSAVLLSSILVNFVLFVKAAATLFELSCKVLEDDKIAYVSTLFFCINPASVFFTAPYSESCFAFFVFSGMLFGLNNTKLLSSLVFGLSGCVRSNGLVNLGYIAHSSLKDVIEFVSPNKRLFSVLYYLCCEVIKFCAYIVIILVPFVMFQTYAYLTFCSEDMEMPASVRQFGVDKGFVMPGSGLSPWCNYSVPFSYSYVQDHYWNVGFLKYYEWKQVPNFLLAVPIIYLLATQSFVFLVQNKSYLVSLGLKKVEFVKFQGRNVRPEFLVFVVHALFLTVFCTLCIHVQVTTRMLASSSPVLYWFVALNYKIASHSAQGVISSRLDALQKSRKYSCVESKVNLDSFWRTCIVTDSPVDRWSYCVRLYFYMYLVVGTVLFSNFYPWT